MKLRPIDNPPNPYLSQHVAWLEPPAAAKVEVFEEVGGSILSRNDSPDLPYTWSVNPYRGCQHACSYCYARCSHEYLGFGAGTDFDTKLIVKLNAPTLLREAFAKRSWTRESVHFSGVTDCYQPLEAAYELTRQCLQVCLDLGNPACVVTKGSLVVRDAELLAALARRAWSFVHISVPFADAAICKLIEPQAPPPARRFEAIRRLREAGVPVGVMVSPIIPGLTDRDIPRILEQAAKAGAQSASYTALRLPGSVREVFVKRMHEVMPLRAKRILHRLRDIRGGRLNDSRFGERMCGSGPYWESITNMFDVFRKRYRLEGGYLSRATCAACAEGGAAHKPSGGQLAFDFAD